MRRAIALAKQVPAFPFGAVIVRRAIGVIVAEGHNRSSESPTFMAKSSSSTAVPPTTPRSIGRN